MTNAMLKEEFTALFRGYKIPKDLKSLFDFQVSEGIPSFYSNTLYLIDEDPEIIQDFSDDTNFVDSFIPFGEADTNGSYYAFWIRDKNNSSLENAPIVVFGGDGGIFVVAKNIKDLLLIASYDVEPIIDVDEISFPDKEVLEEDGEFTATEFNKEYLDWLRNEVKLKPIVVIADLDQLLEDAQNQYGSELVEFAKSFDVEI